MAKSKAKPQRGRPPAAEPLKKRFFRCTDSEWELIEKAAAYGNRSKFIRLEAVGAARRKLKRSAE